MWPLMRAWCRQLAIIANINTSFRFVIGNLEQLIRVRLQTEGPIHVGIVGSGAFAGMIVRHLMHSVPWVRIAAIANRTPQHAIQLLVQSGAPKVTEATTQTQFSDAIAQGNIAVCTEAELLCAAREIEVIIEATGTVEFGARVVMAAIEHGKHVVLCNAELDATLGPVLKQEADAHGVILTHTDGEEPALAARLVRYLSTIGLRPVAAGNLKGMLDRYRTPATQQEFANRHGLNAFKAASFADGTKLSLECCVLANATGFRVGKMGMHGPSCNHVREMAHRLPAEQLLSGGLVDYALAAEPTSGVFAIAHVPDATIGRDLSYFKLGEGPFHVFVSPFHLPSAQIAWSIAEAVLANSATVTPKGVPICEVATVAKRDLPAGEVLDGVGGYCTYGLIENAPACAEKRLLPIGVSEGCRLVRSVRKDTPVRYDDVELPENRLCDRLVRRQAAMESTLCAKSAASAPAMIS